MESIIEVKFRVVSRRGWLVGWLVGYRPHSDSTLSVGSTRHNNYVSNISYLKAVLCKDGPPACCRVFWPSRGQVRELRYWFMYLGLDKRLDDSRPKKVSSTRPTPQALVNSYVVIRN